MLPTVAIIFVESKYFLQNHVVLNLENFFCKYTTAIGSQDSKHAKEIISILYKNNYQNKKSKAPILYYAIDLTILWLVNMTGCC